MRKSVFRHVAGGREVDSLRARASTTSRQFLSLTCSREFVLPWTAMTEAMEAVAWSPHRHGPLASNRGTLKEAIHAVAADKTYELQLTTHTTLCDYTRWRRRRRRRAAAAPWNISFAQQLQPTNHASSG